MVLKILMLELFLPKRLQELQEDIPILLQSSQAEHIEFAKKANIGFLHKNSPRLLAHLIEFLIKNFGFGDFIFKLPNW